jgi:hypothetical protein
MEEWTMTNWWQRVNYKCKKFYCTVPRCHEVLLAEHELKDLNDDQTSFVQSALFWIDRHELVQVIDLLYLWLWLKYETMADPQVDYGKLSITDAKSFIVQSQDVVVFCLQNLH